MRLRKIVKLDDTRSVALNELRVRDARQFMAQAKNFESVEIKTLLTERFDEVADLLGDCLIMPKGENLDDLSFSEVQLIKAALLEINAAFLDLLGLTGLLSPPIPLPDLTAPVSPSSKKATAT